MPVPTFHSYEILPGRFHAGEYPGAATEAQARVKVQAMVDAGVQVFIDLTQERELAPYAHLLPAGIHHERHAIRDVSVPANAEVTRGALDAIDRHLAAGRQVYLHCWGGIGRTGVIVGCWLATQQAVTGEAALQQLAQLWSTCPKSKRRPHSPETEQQRRYVVDWAARPPAPVTEVS
ncbi:protein-tyrosine phosphatase family protein [Sphaerotilus sp.]|uniref:protein-tyrosine phosphatase family protein n=1 Tax=Sphaerotilus sp. TaxID=2093942 RepID=UPI002ACE9389|nr:protein-tyrosine phosphatase family protein [Sphaerotilus sp.]MDZ7855084.1 protein-tyrosine phosphatase family protein [Sphaerotilus sp.]